MDNIHGLNSAHLTVDSRGYDRSQKGEPERHRCKVTMPNNNGQHPRVPKGWMCVEINNPMIYPTRSFNDWSLNDFYASINQDFFCGGK